MPAATDSSASSRSSIKQKLETGLEALIKECPPQFRPVARSLRPMLLGYLQSASEEGIREALWKVRETIDGLLSGAEG